MRVMYWNCTGPADPKDNSHGDTKCKYIGALVRALAPDILCLDEMSANLDDKQTGQTWGDRYLNAGHTDFRYEAANVSVSDGIHLNTVVFVRQSTTGARNPTPRVTVDDQALPAQAWDVGKRDLLHAQWTDPRTSRTISVWFLHANASKSGGKKAVALAAHWVSTDNQHNNDIIMGDFNCPYDQLGAGVFATKAICGGYDYTQWSKSNDKSAGGTLVVGSQTTFLKANAAIDYAVSNKAQTVTLTATDSLAHQTNDWPGIGFLQIYFDHYPVAYDVAAS